MQLNKRFGLRAALLGSVGLMAFAVPALAQESMETVVVTGIRGSLQRSLDIKRESAGVVDAISMEDIGKFPDSNLAAALMRIPGVTVTRAGTMGIATTGEATQITVRGMGPAFNETLFNGRRIPSAVGGRAFDFSGLSADMVSALEVYKSPDASLSAGAIGATVNVKYPNPLEKPGLTLAASASGKYQPNDGRITPNANFLFSDTFFNGKFGVLIAGAYSKMATTQFQVSNWGWIGHKTVQPCQLSGYTGPDCSTISADKFLKDSSGNPTTTPNPKYDINAVEISKNNWFTQDLSYDYNQIQEERKNARISLQFQPSDKLLVTLDANYARDFVYENQYAFAIWNSKGDMRNIKTSSNGTITSFQRYAPTDFDTNVNMGVQQTYDVGLNVKYEVNNNLSVLFDFDQAQSSLNPGDDHWSGYSTDYGYGPSGAGGTNGTTFEVVQPGGKTLPYYKNYGPNGDASRFADTSIMGSHVTTTSATRNRNFVNQVKLEGAWKEDNLTVKFGTNYVADHYHMDYWGPWETNRWQWWSGYGPDSNNKTGVHLPSNLFQGKVYLPTMPGWDSSHAIPYLLKVSAADVWSYLNSLPTSTSGFNASCCSAPYQGITPAGINTRSDGSHQVVYEDTFAVFASMATETKFAGMPLKVNAGIRYEYTNIDTRGIDKPLTELYQVTGDLTAFGYRYVKDPIATAEKSSYQYLLPNLDLVLQATDDLQLRINASRTLTRPNLGDLKPNKSNWGGRVGSLGVSGGNPGELPFLSDNVDFGAEWYYAPNSYFAATTFLKSISNYVVTGTSTYKTDGQEGRPNVIDPTTGTFAVFTLTQPVNGPKANVYGMEIAWQHMFGDSGFGYQLNGTIVQSDKPYRALDAAGSPTNNAFAMTGLADSFNAVAFYDKDGFEIRLAANWRDSYLNNFGQGQSSGTQFGSEPVFVNGVWTLDASTSLDITDNLNVYFEANNLMDVGYSTRGRFSDQVLDVISTGRRFTFGMHYKL